MTVRRIILTLIPIVLIVVGMVVGVNWLAGIFGRKTVTSNKNDKTITQNNKVTPTPSVEPTPTGYSIKVYAAGTASENVYPTMELRINSVGVKQWENIKGDPSRGIFDEFEYISPNKVTPEQVQLAFVNHKYVSKIEDRNLYIDRIVIDGNNYFSDSPATYTEVTDTTLATNRSKCGSGYNRTRWLLCNGYLTFRSYESAFVPTPTPVFNMVGAVIKVYAAGVKGGGAYPDMDLYIKGIKVASFMNVGGDVGKGQLMEYQYSYNGTVLPSEVKIVFTNDFYGKPTDDRNLFVDRISINGKDYYADADMVYETGVWVDGKCQAGYFGSKMLLCPNASMQFGLVQR